MGFLGFLKKGKKAEGVSSAAPSAAADSTPSTDIGLDDVMKTLEGRMADKLAAETKKAEKLYFKISEGLAEAKKHAAGLEKQSFEPGDKTYAMVNMTKDNYVKKANSLIAGLPKIGRMNYAEIAAFSGGARKILNELLNIQPKQAILLTRYFKKESSRVIMALKEADIACREMESLLQGSALGLYSSASETIADIADLMRRSEDLGGRAQGMGEKIAARKVELETRHGDHKAFLAGEESVKHRTLDDELKMRERERTELGNKLNDELSGLKRPVKKLEHAAAKDAKDKEKLALYSRLSHSPLKVMLNEGDSAIAEALVKLREIGLKDEDREHVEELAKKVELGYLSELADKYKWLEAEIAERKAQLEKSSFPESDKKHARDIEDLKREIAELEKELEKAKENRTEVSKKLKDGKRRLEDSLFKQAGLKLNIII